MHTKYTKTVRVLHCRRFAFAFANAKWSKSLSASLDKRTQQSNKQSTRAHLRLHIISAECCAKFISNHVCLQRFVFTFSFGINFLFVVFVVGAACTFVCFPWQNGNIYLHLVCVREKRTPELMTGSITSATPIGSNPFSIKIA